MKNIVDLKKFFGEDLIKKNAKHIVDLIEILRSNSGDFNGEVRSERMARAVGNSSASSNFLSNILQSINIGDLFKAGNQTGQGLAAILSGLTSVLGGTNNPSTISPQTLQVIMSMVQNTNISQVLPQILKMLPQADQLFGNGSNLMNMAQALQNNPSLASALPQVLSSQLANSTMTMLYMLYTAVSNAPSQCSSDLTQMFTGIATGQGWALSMLDAFGKPPAGLKSFRIKWWGDFDECQAVDTASIKGQYCKTSIYISGVDLGGIPISLEEGVCMPSSCPEETVKALLAPAFTALSQSLPNGIGLYVYKAECKIEDMPLDGKAVAMTIVCAGILLILIVATLFDVYITRKMKSGANQSTKQNPEVSKKYEAEGVAGNPVKHPQPLQLGLLERVLLAFSVYTNGKKLLSAKKSAGSLSALHGIRFLSMSWVILGHALALNMGIFGNFYAVAQEWISWTSFQAIQNALVSVDSFFALSGLLVAYLTLKEMKKLGGILKLNWGMFYFHRFWRLTPVYMLLLGMYTCFTKYIGEGPNYNQKDLAACTNKWWTNLLYINNFVYYDYQPAGCLGHSWYLANDMQFYILSPLIMVPFYIHPVLGVIASVIFLGATWGSLIGLGLHYSWPPTQMGGGVDMSNRDKMFAEYYIKPYGRMGPYIIGLITGYILYRTKCKCRMPWFVAVLGWVVATVVACLVLYGLHDAFNNNPLSVDVSVFYLTVHRTVWGACVCWVVFACATGNGGFINTLLSWEAFIPLARLTYCAYLIHPILMEVYVGTLRHPIDLTIISLSFLNIAYLVSSMAFAFILSVAFESPMMALEKIVFGKDKKKPELMKQKANGHSEIPIVSTVYGNGVSNGLGHQKMPDETVDTLYPKIPSETVNEKM
ncbi:hypothetical protein FSP39_000145 [Pinctada imbricata]|uniref:Nose resistant-to-fluoxetine protein N-terminal domain-containing protein n=1 Tax=Pinctada imbricata TaxID=66713 RepID=A0AA89BQ23_PINIB|nr:hypothetical protein FSP39_000145 [Pinctada imbricata]